MLRLPNGAAHDLISTSLFPPSPANHTTRHAAPLATTTNDKRELGMEHKRARRPHRSRAPTQPTPNWKSSTCARGGRVDNARQRQTHKGHEAPTTYANAARTSNTHACAVAALLTRAKRKSSRAGTNRERVVFHASRMPSRPATANPKTFTRPTCVHRARATPNPCPPPPIPNRLARSNGPMI